MPLMITDLFERLKSWDEFELLDALGITSDDLVERFKDVIEDKFDYFTEQLQWDTDYGNEEED